MKIKYVVYGLIFLILGYLIYNRITVDAAASSKDKGPKKPSLVSGIVAKTQPFDNTLEVAGSVEADEQVEIRSEISGIVQSISFTEGQLVQKGQVLFTVNDIELRAQLAKAQTAQKLASENARRAQLLLEKEAISREEFDIATADFQSAKAETQLIQAQINKAKVRAPFSGIIGLRNISPGTYVTPTTLIAKLVNSQRVKITFSVPEKYANQVANNTMVTFTAAGLSGTRHAKIYALEPEVTRDTRTLTLRALAENTDGKLLPGSFAKVTLPLAQIPDAIIIPTQAIIPVQNGKKVFVLSGGKAKEVLIETSTRTQSEIVVLQGLKSGDTVVTTGVMQLKEGAPIQVKIAKTSNE